MKRLTIFSIALIILLNSVVDAQEQTKTKPEDAIKVELGRSAEEYFNIGNWYSDREQHFKAIAYYKAALNKNPEYTVALINMGTSFKAVERYEEAIESYRKAIDLGTKENFVFLNLGNALLEAGKLREATIAFRTFIELEPYDPAGYSRLGYSLYTLKDYAEAASTFEKLTVLEKDNEYFPYQAARCYALLKKYDESLRFAKIALSLEPNIRFVILEEEDFLQFRRSEQFKELLAEMQKIENQKQ